MLWLTTATEIHCMNIFLNTGACGLDFRFIVYVWIMLLGSFPEYVCNMDNTRRRKTTAWHVSVSYRLKRGVKIVIRNIVLSDAIVFLREVIHWIPFNTTNLFC